MCHASYILWPTLILNLCMILLTFSFKIFNFSITQFKVYLDILKFKSWIRFVQGISSSQKMRSSTLLLRSVRFPNPYLNGSFKKKKWLLQSLFDRLIFFAIWSCKQFFLCKTFRKLYHWGKRAFSIQICDSI